MFCTWLWVIEGEKQKEIDYADGDCDCDRAMIGVQEIGEMDRHADKSNHNVEEK